MAAVYFTAADGIEYRVLDCTMREGRWRVADPPGPSWATDRVFRPKSGNRWLYHFRPGESREPHEDLLRAQRAAAHYLPEKPYVAPNVDPR